MAHRDVVTLQGNPPPLEIGIDLLGRHLAGVGLPDMLLNQQRDQRELSLGFLDELLHLG